MSRCDDGFVLALLLDGEVKVIAAAGDGDPTAV